MKIIAYDQISQDIFDQVMEIWLKTGLANPARADDYAAVNKTLRVGAALIVAYLDNEAIGTVWLTHDSRRAYIHHMGVVPEHQGKGIGRALLSEALSIASKLGLQAKLEVHQDNPSALHLYESLGFQTLDGYQTMIKRDI